MGQGFPLNLQLAWSLLSGSCWPWSGVILLLRSSKCWDYRHVPKDTQLIWCKLLWYFLNCPVVYWGQMFWNKDCFVGLFFFFCCEWSCCVSQIHLKSQKHLYLNGMFPLGKFEFSGVVAQIQTFLNNIRKMNSIFLIELRFFLMILLLGIQKSVT